MLERFWKKLNPQRAGLFFLLWATVFTALFDPTPLFAQAEYKTLLAFGSVIPIHTDQAENVPLIFVRYRDRFKKPTLQANVVTGSLTISYRPQIDTLDWEGVFTGKILVHGSTGSLYSRGAWLENKGFYGHSSLQMIKLHYNLDEDQDISIAFGNRYHTFERSEITQVGMQLPSNFMDWISSFEWHGDWGDWHRLEPHFTADITYEGIERQRWEAWDLEASVGKPRRLHAKFTWNQKWENSQKSEIQLDGGTGSGVDFFSSFPIGGLGGHFQLPGYYRDEFRAKKFILSKIKHSWVATKGPTFALYAAFAKWDLMGLAYQSLDRPRSSAYSVGFELFYPIEALKGLPIVMIYGKGMNPPEGSPAPHRDEILLGLVAAF